MLELRQNLRDGLGNEFELEGCWYLPMTKGGQRVSPLPRVLRYWMRAAGFTSATHVGKVADRDSERKNVEGWLGEGPAPEIGSLHKLVDEFAGEVVWTGRPSEWKGRLTLARAMQVLCKRVDAYFAVLHRAASTRLAGMLKAVEAERVAVDEGGILFSAETFFAARLLQRRLMREGTWEAEIVARIPKNLTFEVPPGITREAEEAMIRHRRGQIEPGNWFVKYLQRRLSARRGASCEDGPLMAMAHLRERIFQLGIEELNALLDAKRGRGQSPPALISDATAAGKLRSPAGALLAACSGSGVGPAATGRVAGGARPTASIPLALAAAAFATATDLTAATFCSDSYAC